MLLNGCIGVVRGRSCWPSPWLIFYFYSGSFSTNHRTYPQSYRNWPGRGVDNSVELSTPILNFYLGKQFSSTQPTYSTKSTLNPLSFCFRGNIASRPFFLLCSVPLSPSSTMVSVRGTGQKFRGDIPNSEKVYPSWTRTRHLTTKRILRLTSSKKHEQYCTSTRTVCSTNCTSTTCTRTSTFLWGWPGMIAVTSHQDWVRARKSKGW